MVKVAVSSVSAANALLNLDAEIPDWILIATAWRPTAVWVGSPAIRKLNRSPRRSSMPWTIIAWRKLPTLLEGGGAAALRLVEFLPVGKTEQVTSYSPYYGTWMTDSGNRFVLTNHPPLSQR